MLKTNTRKNALFIFGCLITVLVVFGPVILFNQAGEGELRLRRDFILLHSFIAGFLFYSCAVLLEDGYFHFDGGEYLMAVMCVLGLWLAAFGIRCIWPEYSDLSDVVTYSGNDCSGLVLSRSC